MTRQILTNPTKTYKTRQNAVKAIEKKLANYHADTSVNYLVAVTEEGRFFPVVIGTTHVHLIHAGLAVAG